MIEQELNHEKIDIGKRIVSIIGPEGSGKTTQAKLLSENTGKPYLSTGDTLRACAANDQGRFGEACRIMFSEHTYLDGHLLLEIMSERFAKNDTENGFVIDGGFRTKEESIAFEQTLTDAGRNLPVVVIKLNLPVNMSYERLVKNTRGRTDDTEDAIRCRLEKYYNGLEDRLAVIRSNPNWKIIEIDATNPTEEVQREILNRLTA